ncbi:Nonsense-mediated mRNA decay NMD3 like protein [Thermococcus sp. M39]|uniref:60S ribosomal export protein NMD3 n=1 Tax=unclassified Thermococcus TaxID=2627626 RepID=UPI0014396B47|nr:MULTISPECIES: 60S ribosomal export protein NMD3 [unclassified Thermococcus]NJE07067.1 Nonsense-mediated mRNA decay NMD3 like protein [Thermococcus sp. M39]NJE13605.1 Nonsense-mediated mRNA decay NMD3 like protein [Thermococcus sp. LS2]
MSERFCYRCGIGESEGGPLIDGLCQVCFRKENPVLLMESELNTELCQNCGSYKKKGVWVDPQNYELDQLIFEVAENALLENLALDERVKEIRIIPKEELDEIEELPVGVAYVSYEPVNWHIDYFPAIVIYEVEVKARIHELQKELHYEKKTVTVYVRQTVCPRCQKFLGGYFEAILQVRAEDRELTKEERDEIVKLVQEKVDEIMKKDRMGFIQDTVELDEGIDFYMGSTRSARKLAQAIRDKYGGTISEAYELVGLDRQTSKEVYRTSVSVRLPKFRKGDIVSDKNGNVYRVEEVNGKGMNLTNLATHESEHKDWKTIKREGVDLVEHERKEAMLTSLTPKEAQFMDMENYETFEIERPKIDLKEGEIYKLVKIKGKYYIESKKE